MKTSLTSIEWHMRILIFKTLLFRKGRSYEEYSTKYELTSINQNQIIIQYTKDEEDQLQNPMS